METTKKFDKRAFTSIGLLVTSVILPISIFIRHMPVFEESRHGHHLFTSIHATAGIFFIILLVMHLILNWKAFKKYLSGDKQTSRRKEVFVSVAFMIFVLLLFSTWDYFIH